jgi:putative FmdB family regulatory protein
MPRYEFLCETCGAFDCWRSFAEASDPMPCPTCKTAAKRIYSLPGLVKTPASLTHALDRANKSAYEPQVVKHEHQYATGETKPAAAPIQQRHGRPWQIGH